MLNEENENPWGDEPDWAASDSESLSSTGVQRESSHRRGPLLSIPAAQHILILIDANRTMFQPYIHHMLTNLDETVDTEASAPNITITPFDTAVAAASHLLHDRVHNAATTRTGKRDGVGIILFNVPASRHSGNRNGDDNGDDDDIDPWETSAFNPSLNMFVDLKPPGVQEVCKVRKCIPKSLYGRGVTCGDYDDDDRDRNLATELYGIKSGSQPEESNEDGNGHGQGNDDNFQDDALSSLRSALYQSNHAFTNAKCVKKSSSSTSIEREDSKTVWIFTNDDDPMRGGGGLDQITLAARDVVENDVDIRLMALPKANGEDFDKSLFYDNITTVEENEEEEAFVRRHGHRRSRIGNGSQMSSSQQSIIGWGESQSTIPIIDDFGGVIRNELKLDVLLNRICLQWKKVRKTQTLPMYLPDWKLGREQERTFDDEENAIMGNANDEHELEPAHPSMATSSLQQPRTSPFSPRDTRDPGIMLDIFQTVRIRRKPTPVTIHSRTNKKTNRVTEVLSKETGEIVAEGNIRYYTEFGGSQIPMSKKDMNEIKENANAKPDEACLILLGFKPKLDISKLYQYPLVEKATFAYPNDEVVKGSKAAFASLHSSMVRKQVMGIGELLLRVTANSRLVAIIPQVEEREAEGGSEEEEGDTFIQITPPGFLLIPLAYEDDIRAVPDGDDVAEEDMVTAAEAIIRNQNIQPDHMSFENPALKTFWNYIESVALGTPLEDLDSDDDNTKLNVEGVIASCGSEIEAFKKLLPEDDVITKERKRKAAQLVEDTTEIKWFEQYTNDTLENLKVDDLKAYLRSFGEKLGGRKADLVDRIKAHIQNRIANGSEDTTFNDDIGKSEFVLEQSIQYV